MTAVSMVEWMADLLDGKLVDRKVVCWVDWSDNPMVEMRVASRVEMMADKLVAVWVASMVEMRVVMSDGKLVVRMAECWVER